MILLYCLQIPQISSQLNNDVLSLKIKAASWKEIWVLKHNRGVHLKTKGPVLVFAVNCRVEAAQNLATLVSLIRNVTANETVTFKINISGLYQESGDLLRATPLCKN